MPMSGKATRSPGPTKHETLKASIHQRVKLLQGPVGVRVHLGEMG